MIKHFCDRCGKELKKRIPIELEYAIGVDVIEKYEICEECSDDFKRFMNQEDIHTYF